MVAAQRPLLSYRGLDGVPILLARLGCKSRTRHACRHSCRREKLYSAQRGGYSKRKRPVQFLRQGVLKLSYEAFPTSQIYGVFGSNKLFPVAEIHVVPLAAKMSVLAAPPVGPRTVKVPASMFSMLPLLSHRTTIAFFPLHTPP